MIDYFALALGHGLLVIAFFRLVTADALDDDALAAEAGDREDGDDRDPRNVRKNGRTPQ